MNLNQKKLIIWIKKQKFEQQSVGYIDPKFKGDDNKEAGVAKQKKQKYEEQ